jgi:hypothetical protein
MKPAKLTVLTEPIQDRIRRCKDIYLYYSPNSPITERLVFSIMYDASALGAKDIQWLRDGQQNFVGSKLNWLHRDGDTEINLFNRVWPFPEAGENSCRHEVAVAAFANTIVCISEQVIVVKGSISDFDPEWWNSVINSKNYGIAFLMAEHQSL